MGKLVKIENGAKLVVLNLDSHHEYIECIVLFVVAVSSTYCNSTHFCRGEIEHVVLHCYVGY